MVEKINPYIAGAPVTEARMFFGREDVFSWIERSLSGKFVNHILVIHGQRRVGKTSVLKHLHARLPEKYLPVFVDLQGRVNTNLPRFLWWLSREITRTLDMPSPDRKFFETDGDYFESGFLPEVEKQLGDRILLLTFDEFDTLESSTAQESLALPFLAILKHLMGHEKLNFIFSIGSSGRKLENMQAAYTGFFKQALYRKISFLGENDARELVTRPVEGIVRYDLDAVDHIYDITSGHPYFIQLICHELFSVCQKLDRWQVSKADVDDVLDAVIERGTVNLKFVWDEASELEKWVLASLAQFEKGADLSMLDKYLKKQKVRFIRQDLESAILHLREKDVLASGNHFVIYLMKLWLIQNRSIEQVREELSKVNPIVGRLLQVGYEYLDQGEPEKAIGIFQEALEAEEDNYEVRMGLAGAYRAREDFGRAAAEYEEILLLFPEDVAAQSGYCSTYLALGDHLFAMDRLDEAEYAYQQVLRVSPRHADGCRQMARLYHHRAVSAISSAEGTALEKAQKALEYTPNDSDLQASVYDLEALVSGERGMKEVLLAWGTRASENRYWKDAAGLFEAYQRMLGKDEAAPPALANIRQRAQEEQASSLRSHAERMERLGEYEEAIYALNKYLSLTPEDDEQVALHIKQLKDAHRRTQVKDGRERVKPFWKRPLVWVGAALIATLALFAVLPGSPLQQLISGPESTPAAEDGSSSPTEIAETEPEDTPVSLEESRTMPELADWVVEANTWAEPILEAVAYQSPDFEDDFSKVDPAWYADIDDNYCSNRDAAKISISDGAMQRSVSPDCPFSWVSHPDLPYKDYVLQVDITFPQGDIRWGINTWPLNPGEESYQTFNFLLSKFDWTFETWNSTTESGTNGPSGNTEVDYRKPVTLTIINRGATYLYYLNSEVLTSYELQMPYDGPQEMRFMVENWTDRLTDVETLEMDNVRIWNLDNLVLPETILALIEGQPPYFSDDFSAVDSHWQYSPLIMGTESTCPNTDGAQMSISDGSMKCSVDPDCREGVLYHQAMQLYENYVLKADIDFDQTLGTVEFRTGFPLEKGVCLFLTSYGGWILDVTESGGNTVDKVEGRLDFVPSGPVTVTMINKDATVFYYVNSTLLVSYPLPETHYGPVNMDFNFFSESPSLSQSEAFELDNVKIWNLDTLIYPETILAAVGGQQPDFSEDFSQVDPQWAYSTYELHSDESCSNTDGAQLSIKTGVARCGVDSNCRQGILFHPAMQNYENFVVQADVDFNQTSGNMGFQMFFPTEREVALDLTSSGSWSLSAGEPGDDSNFDRVDGRIEFDPSEPVTFTMINKDSTVFYYINSTLLVSYSLPEIFYGPVHVHFNLFSESPNLPEGEAFEVDNVKVWDLDRLEQ